MIYVIRYENVAIFQKTLLYIIYYMCGLKIFKWSHAMLD